MGTELSWVHELQHVEPPECWRLLKTTNVGRLAVSIKNHPDIFPVNYAVVGESIVINSAPGTKLAAAVLGTAVAFEVDALDPITRTGWSVVLKGQAKEINDIEGLLEAEDLDIGTWTDWDKTRFVRLAPDEVTGRRI
jgi:nitroimidazol reductase NimA-like FMN-containing flavoprotein (pyridoxamine 5'-phosphate oxidase superfamily)